MARVNFNTTIDEATREAIKRLAVGRSQGEVIDAAISLLEKGRDDSPALLEVLEHVRSMAGTLPTGEDIEHIVDAVVTRKNEERQSRPHGNGFDPSNIPGVQVGARGLQPRRETGNERAQRERQERQDRIAAQDPVNDPSIDRSDEFVSS